MNAPLISLGQKHGTFMGGKILGAQITVETQEIDLTQITDWQIQRTGYISGYMLELELEHTRGLDRGLYDVLDGGGMFGMREIGWAHVCKYCGTTFVAGNLICSQCGGPTEYYERAAERAAISGYIESMYPIQVNHYAPGRPGYNDQLLVRIRMMERPRVILSASGKTVIDCGELSHVTHPQARLCPWCGALCPWESNSCPQCGGHRLPISQLQDLRRQCWYCGHTTIGNYICEACNVGLVHQDTPRVFAQGAYYS